MKIGQRISELRKDHRLKQKDLAAALGVAVSTVSNYETDCHEPDLNNLCKLADLFGVSTDYLLGRTEVSLEVGVFHKNLYEDITIADLLMLTRHFSDSDWDYLMKALKLLNCQYETRFHPHYDDSWIYELKKRS